MWITESPSAPTISQLFLNNIDSFPSNGTVYRFESMTLSVNTVAENQNFEVYPNPANGIFSITADKQLKSIKIFSIEGKEIAEIKDIFSEQTELDLTRKKRGIYFLMLTFKDGTTSKSKIVLE